MPIPEIDALSKGSSPEQQKAAISACIAQEVHSGKEQEQAVATCHQMARDKTGGSPTAPKAEGK